MMTPVAETHPGLDPDRFRDALRVVYDALDAEVGKFGPKCAVSGRCCRFDEYGHTLFVSAPEFTILLADAPAPTRALDAGATCPWQDDRGRCTARDARPLGCRVYFCDPAYQQHLPEVGEAAIAHLKRVVADLDLPWDYAPLHRHLQRARVEGRFPTLGEVAS
jgi:Fe-S-cluster containining protein